MLRVPMHVLHLFLRPLGSLLVLTSISRHVFTQNAWKFRLVALLHSPFGHQSVILNMTFTEFDNAAWRLPVSLSAASLHHLWKYSKHIKTLQSDISKTCKNTEAAAHLQMSLPPHNPQRLLGKLPSCKHYSPPVPGRAANQAIPDSLETLYEHHW